MNQRFVTIFAVQLSGLWSLIKGVNDMFMHETEVVTKKREDSI